MGTCLAKICAKRLDFSELGTQKTPIQKTELRAMTLDQLQQLIDFIDRYADKKGFLRDSNGQPWLDWEGKPLHKDRINLYDVTKYIIKPATAEQKCSYVELVAPAGTTSQEPKWFVSHWWGEPVKDFFKALKEHARVRKLKKTDAYWVCAYANNAKGDRPRDPADPRGNAEAVATSRLRQPVLQRTAPGRDLVLKRTGRPNAGNATLRRTRQKATRRSLVTRSWSLWCANG